MELNIPSAVEQCFLLSIFSRRGNLFLFPCTLIWSELNYIAICLCRKDLDLIFLLNRLVIYSMPTAMSSITGNHTMDSFYLLNKNFKNLLFGSLITGRSFENLCYLSSCSLSQRRRFRRIRTNVLRGIESDLPYTKVSVVVFQYIIRSRSLWHPPTFSL